MAGGGESTRAIAAAFLANMGIAAAKFVGYLLTGSSSMLAESIHSVADSSNQGLLFLGGRRARRPPTPLHPFGFGRVRYFWAFVVGIVLFSVGGLFSLYEGWHKVSEPEDVTSPAIALAILAVAIGLESFALRTAVSHARPFRGDRSWPQYVRESRSPELPVLLVEDLAALVGLILAVIGVGLSWITGDGLWDGIGTLGIGVVLIFVAVLVAREMKSSLIGESAEPVMLARIEAELTGAPHVRRIIHMITQHIGPDELLVGAKLEFDPDLSIPELAAAIDACEQRVRAAVPIARVMYLEPDFYRERSSDPDSSEPSEAAPA
jgi:cation diffusion facilitator family transporter